MRQSLRALPPLLPRPVHAERREGSFSVSSATSAPPILFACPDGRAPSARDLASARALQSEVERRSGVVLPIEAQREREGIDSLGPRITLRIAAQSEMPSDMPERCRPNPEAYRLDVSSERIEIIAAGSAGLRWGVETLCQLISGARIPACRIDDAPDFQMRGIMLDVSRGKVPTQETLHELVDTCARLKLNVLMLYTEHTFRFRKHPKIGADDSPLDASSMRTLDAYADAQSVELIPCLQSLGHMEHVLKHPEYAQLDESGEGWTLSPVDPGTYSLLRDLYDEYLPNFSSSWLNANCDEPWDLARGRSKQRSDELGPGGLYLEHVHRLQALARANGKRMMIWGDVVHAHPERIPEIDRDLVLLDWWYEAQCDYDRVRVFAENGLEFAVCPGTSSWNCLFPRIENSERNMEGWAAAGRRHGALGYINTDWGDFGHYNLQGNSWFGYAYGAQQCWSGEIDAREFDRAFSRRLFDDPSGTVARLYRALGAIHDPGFPMFNGSALQFLYFDEVEDARFISAAKPAALRRCERALERVLEKIVAAETRFGPRKKTFEEMRYAAEATRFAVRKALATHEYLAWRRSPGRLSARERKALARRFDSLADQQAKLGRTLRRLWLARSAISNLDMTLGRIRRATRSLRKASRNLERNRPTPTLPQRDKISMREAFNAMREATRTSSA